MDGLQIQDLTLARPTAPAEGRGSESSPAKQSPPPGRLEAVEGLRAYLALWVVVCHVFWASGIEAEALSGLAKLLRLGPYAVDVFIIVSGFVIFMSLDSGRMSYRQFVVRRFFRLFPVFLVLFAVAIPLSRLSMWNVSHATQYLTPAQVQSVGAAMAKWWENIHWHVPLHLLMLHGLVPEILLEDAPSAFLIPAWSVSLEWQFYLIAPLAYVLALSSNPLQRLGLLAACLVLFLSARLVIPTVPHGAALPFHVEFFFLGAVSYFIYKHRSAYRIENFWFPVACCFSVFLLLGVRSWLLVPLALWIAFLGLILERPASISSRLLSPIFTSAPIQYLGRISYSVYLSHILIIVVVQHALLVGAPQLTRPMHFGGLLCLTLLATVAVSSLLYRFVEAPGIKVGRSFALALSRPRAARTHDGQGLAPGAAALDA